MPIRNGWKKRDWLVIDEESGVTKYWSQVKFDYTGAAVTKRYADFEQPQDFVKALNDPHPVSYTNPPDRDWNVICTPGLTIGNTDVPAIDYGPALHLFDVGIGEAEIGCTFIVR